MDRVEKPKRRHVLHKGRAYIRRAHKHRLLRYLPRVRLPRLQTPAAALGQPLDTLSKRRFQALAKTVEVKRIKFHGVRHTVATLSLQAGTPPHVVADRLGHSVMELMKTYAHALLDQQQDAATRLGGILHG